MTAPRFMVMEEVSAEDVVQTPPTGIPLEQRLAWTIAEAGAMLGVGTHKVYDMLRDGLPCVKLTRTIRIRPQALAAYLERKEGPFGDATPVTALPLPKHGRVPR